MDPSENANRRYAVGVQSTLFDPVAIVRFWGSRQTSYQQVMVQAFNNVSEARDAADKVIRRKARKGYFIVGGYVPPGLDVHPADGDAAG